MAVITGTPSSETLVGTSGNDEISALAGDDKIQGGAGNDSLEGGAGNDTLDGGDGTDTAAYATATSAVLVDLSVTSAQDTVGAGIDTLIGIENILGSAFNDVLLGSAIQNRLEGGAGNDSLAGRDGDDILDGGIGTNTLDGGVGTDRVSYLATTRGVTVNLAIQGMAQATGISSDTLVSIEEVRGSEFNDVLTGGAGNNVLVGGLGDDRLDGGAGNDFLNGGDGWDTVTYATASAGVTVDLSIGVAQATGGSGNDRLLGIETLIGSAFDDVLSGDGRANELRGGNGNDVVLAGGGDDTVFGGFGDDRLDGGDGFDTLSFQDSSVRVAISLLTTTAQDTGRGRFTVTGFEKLIGSSGRDTLTGDRGDNHIIGGGGNLDLISGLGGNDILEGGSNSTLLGGNGHDTFLMHSFATADGGNGNDVFHYKYNCTVFGGAGDDLIVPTHRVGDNVNGGDGFDTLILKSHRSSFTVGTSQIERVIDDGASRTLTGGAASEWLHGNGGNDTLNGLEGDDFLFGGRDRDTMTGGTGADHFVYLLITDAIVDPNGGDRITDFNGAEGDRIDLTALDAVKGRGNDAFRFVDAFSGTAGELTATATLTDTYLVRGDIDGDGLADFSILVNSAAALTANDFLL